VPETSLSFISGDRPPVITQQPASLAVGIGTNASFAVVASSTAPLSYHWQRNQADLADGSPYSGVLADTLTISGAYAAQAGAYRCVVSNTIGSVTSEEATLQVLSPDFNGDGYVDMIDFSHLQLCQGTTKEAGLGSCSDADLNHDDAVNTLDVSKFAGCLNGDSTHFVPGCLTIP